MKRYREPLGGGDVSLHRDPADGYWIVVEMIADVSFTRRHRFWIVAYLDYLTV